MLKAFHFQVNLAIFLIKFSFSALQSLVFLRFDRPDSVWESLAFSKHGLLLFPKSTLFWATTVEVLQTPTTTALG